jgi:uncharacterized damage-inducible protein DinB
MSAPAVADPRYPVGKFQQPTTSTEADRKKWIADIEVLPAKLREAVRGLNTQQLDTPYRDGGWTVRQLVHHVPDSHLNAYCRLKLALTEDVPTIKPYDEKSWAELPDTYATPVEVSLNLLEAVHVRWVNILKALTPAQFPRKFNHPEMGELSIDQLLALYAWHSRHHLAHITELRKRKGW